MTRRPRARRPLGEAACFLLHVYCDREGCNARGEFSEAMNERGARREARRAGWVRHRDGFWTCPGCRE